MSTSKLPYYFRFVVSDHYAHEFFKLGPAKRFAKKIGEKVYLQIFLRRNIYKEPYNECVITDFEDILPMKQTLILSVQKYLPK